MEGNEYLASGHILHGMVGFVRLKQGARVSPTQTTSVPEMSATCRRGGVSFEMDLREFLQTTLHPPPPSPGEVSVPGGGDSCSSLQADTTPAISHAR